MTTHHDAAHAGLSPDSAFAYAQIALLPVKDVDACLAAALCGTDPDAAAITLRSLTSAGLLEECPDEAGAGPRGRVFRFPSPELRRQAQETAHPHGQDQRLVLVLGWALAATAAADALITPSHHHTLGLEPVAPDHPVRHTGPDGALAWLTAQGDNLIALVRAAHTAGHHTYVWRTVYSMWPWWRSDARHDWTDLHTLALDSLRQDSTGPALAERHLLNALGLAQRDSGALDQAVETFYHVFQLAQTDVLGTAQAFHELGVTHLKQLDLAQAQRVLSLAQDLSTSEGYERGVALSDIALGEVALAEGRPEEALSRFVTARNALLDEPDPHDAARALAHKGRALIQLGCVPDAEEALHEALLEVRAAQAPHLAARVLEWLGQAAEASDRPADARTYYTQAREHYQPLNPADAARVQDLLTRMT
ncbi:tetratricopeptide repeat protein [Streptomyces sp. NPDC058195]|uniref:tetratricopeptide repeat protein n=1 Tax=Streptomyces sp. NPDC058195 TaxID=3346375 RepID=UPI0036EC43D4